MIRMIIRGARQKRLDYYPVEDVKKLSSPSRLCVHKYLLEDDRGLLIA